MQRGVSSSQVNLLLLMHAPTRPVPKWNLQYFPVPETCRPLLHNLTTLHLQQGWNNLAEAVSAAKNPLSSFKHTHRIFNRRIHNPDNPGHSQLPWLPTPQLSAPLPVRATVLPLLPLLLHQPHCHTGCNIFFSLETSPQQAAGSRPYPNSILQPGHYDIPWVHYDTSPFSQVFEAHFIISIPFLSSTRNTQLCPRNQSRIPLTKRWPVPEESWETSTTTCHRWLPALDSLSTTLSQVFQTKPACQGFASMILLHQKHLLVKHGRYPPSSQESTSDPFSPATGGECLTCGAALSGTRQWRSSNTTSSQLCDSCANYSKMNRPPGSTSTSGGRGSPPSRSKSGAAPPPTGNRRTGMNCANCRCVELFSLLSILHQSQHKHNNFVAEEQRRGASVQRLRTLLQTARHQSTAVKEERGHPIQV